MDNEDETNSVVATLPENHSVTREQIFADKAEKRKEYAKASFESKLEDLWRLQVIAYELSKSAGRETFLPWHTTEVDGKLVLND